MKYPQLQMPVDPLKYTVSQWFGKPAASTAHFYEELGLDGHNGIDFKCPVGTSLVACFDGEIRTDIYSDGTYAVKITNKELNLVARYLHLSKFAVTKAEVKQGDLVGYSGNTGKYTTGPHLHFDIAELTRNYNIKNYDNGYGGRIDPVPYLAKKFAGGTFIKTPYEPKVYEIMGQTKWWIRNEETFEKMFGYAVGGAKIEEVDLITFNFYEDGEIRFIS